MIDPNHLTIIIPAALLLLQLPATALLMSRLIKGPSRIPPLEPDSPTLDLLGACTAVVPTLNEAERIAPCLEGLSHQSYELREVVVVDSYSVDGTGDLVKAAAEKDPRFRLINDDPLPPGWVGRPWALNWGFLATSEKCEWILGIDADTQPHPGLIASLLKTAAAGNYDLISLSPQFILKYPGELWLQPALLMTLVYRFGPTGTGGDVPERVMANGQCFLCKREVLVALGGYEVAKGSFCDDVTLARYAAAQGFKVGFLDGAKVLKVRMYEGAIETWNEWGRSLDLKDAASGGQIWGDLWLLLAVQGLPVPIVLWYLLSGSLPAIAVSGQFGLWGLNVFLVAVRSALCFAIAPSYDRTQASGKWLFWLSPLADPLAFVRILISAFNQPTQWRGRKYS
ncbi:MAG: glycosyltransferase [Microcoleus sp. PH2017_29_MFU_D_A]|jgi:dolichol-phosphate mannosyltransferase|uniref:2'-O-glycosyltransferase CruG n=1 Tax=unclassified Microcoleus TaxID=2642155 RepID=UPI001D3F5603|nr:MULTISPECIES: glycosyltransferase family 2 protein [unclassified Microcoleus]TAF84060.1 MAG: glycosyltransferase [Oscillatoriales cyanobacterium]MCC3451622.1 glycosyltransferase [Microcoleus sp. PH2017_09_SFU_O_A]MCC3585646.1 glycosyltransferase [Microcoleus sp. PH2017_30_WIL_O_A]MCC3591530.1 glycosyltransferase [Microcoleus sp. PH2017_28_MFU_U_A]MCC3603962.1 glycosyltransferase [Microcoleus sp. PH2017_29_MFU_D_A]